ncbi:MAG TPA: hypothetical protein VFO77_14670 [Actinoplanes sp.]|nr:hypothetical protein [Actinoplanes sp.]
MTDSYAAPFIAMFESLGLGPRFQRGRRDARAGHVRSLTISSSLVVAQVRGPDEPVAHRARIAVRAFGAAEWARITDELAAEARHVADLLAGRMPADIDAVVARAGLQLLPLSIDEVAMDCACERWPMPCSHLAATCYALAAAFDTDPFAVLAWRGQGRDDLLDRLRQLRGAAEPPSAQPTAAPQGLDLENFWHGTPPKGPPTAAATPIAVTAAPAVTRHPDALLDQLAPLPLAVGGRPVTELLRPLYRAMAVEPDRAG